MSDDRKSHVTHGASRVGAITTEFRAWAGMINRCTNSHDHCFHNYGVRGIKICERWNTFEVFLADMGYKPKGTSLDRINNAGDYEPSNCRWATVKQQSRNKRTSRMVSYNGETLALAEWVDRLDLRYWTVKSRLDRGWTAERAFFAPLRITRATALQPSEP